MVTKAKPRPERAFIPRRWIRLSPDSEKVLLKLLAIGGAVRNMVGLTHRETCILRDLQSRLLARYDTYQMTWSLTQQGRWQAEILRGVDLEREIQRRMHDGF